jgi:hypothetical protein
VKVEKSFDLQTLRPHGKIYGCNALYRDFTPDHLTAVDHGIMHEIYNSVVIVINNRNLVKRLDKSAC